MYISLHLSVLIWREHLFLLTLTKADSFSLYFNINWYSSFCLYFSTNEEYQARTQEWDDSTIPRKRIQREMERRIVNLLLAKQETRCWKTISFTLKYLEFFLQFPGRKICWRRSERNSGRRRNLKIKNPSNNSSTFEIHPTNVGDLEKKRKEPEIERNLSQTNPTRAKKPLIWKDSRS